jgi:hypothetical protein
MALFFLLSPLTRFGHKKDRYCVFLEVVAVLKDAAKLPQFFSLVERCLLVQHLRHFSNFVSTGSSRRRQCQGTFLSCSEILDVDVTEVEPIPEP